MDIPRNYPVPAAPMTTTPSMPLKRISLYKCPLCGSRAHSLQGHPEYDGVMVCNANCFTGSWENEAQWLSIQKTRQLDVYAQARLQGRRVIERHGYKPILGDKI